MMPELIKNNNIAFYLEEQNKASNLNSFIITEVCLEVLEMFLDSPGPETRTQINSTYLAKVNSTLTDPTSVNHSIELLDPGEDEPQIRSYNPLISLVENPVPINPLENLAQDPLPSSASPTKTPNTSKLFEFVKAIIRKIIQLKSK